MISAAVPVSQRVAILRRLIVSEADASNRHRAAALFSPEQARANADRHAVREKIADELRHLDSIGALEEIERVMKVAEKAARRSAVA